MSHEEENLRLLAARHPDAFRAVEQAAASSDGEAAAVRILVTPSGRPTATLRGVYLHSLYDPLRDAAAQVEKDVDAKASAVIVMGFGLGYGAEAVRLRHPRLPLLIVEPDAALFRAALSSRPLAALLSDQNVILHVGSRPEGLPALLEGMPLARPCFLRLRPVWEKNPTPYRAAEEVVQSWLLRKDINVNTLNRFGRLWVRNLTHNLRRFLSCPGVARLQGVFEGIPALVVAGGPSFDEIAPRLPALAKRLLVVCVNTSLGPCLAAGVQPDFAVVVDPQYWASRYLDWTAGWQGTLVAEPSTHPRVFRSSGSGVFLCSSLFPLGETLETAVGIKGKLGAGGSVATSAWDLARLLGARPIFTAGLDLGFPGMRTHCRGVFVEKLWQSSAGRLHPFEGTSFRGLRDIGLFPVRSASGGVTLTDRRMLLYKWWFENQMEMRPEVSSRTLSPEGVEIKGMALCGLEEALALPVARRQILERMALVTEIQRQADEKSRDAGTLQKSVGELIQGLQRLHDAASRGMALSHELSSALEC
ncbi:MAG: 6-hydroxymethylpterin diphosphokinase MptE-like protein, partial [Spirochaetia bacterium]